MTSVIIKEGSFLKLYQQKRGYFMEKSQRIAAQIYGYTVCVVAVITF